MNNFTKPLIGGEKRDSGVLQIFTQSTDSPKIYSTGLGGTYDLTLTDIILIHSGDLGKEYALQIISDTLRLDRGNGNDNIKFISKDYGANNLSFPIKLRQAELRNWVSVSFQQIGTVGLDINDPNDATDYNVILTIAYEKL
jgi:hypothetical protein